MTVVTQPFLAGVDRDKLDPILDACVAVYNQELDEEGRVDFKGKAKALGRTYSFLSVLQALIWADSGIYHRLLRAAVDSRKCQAQRSSVQSGPQGVERRTVRPT